MGLLQYVSNCQWTESAPLRTITVRDSLSDLPEIRNGHRKEEMSYGTEPESHFQRMVRDGLTALWHAIISAFTVHHFNFPVITLCNKYVRLYYSVPEIVELRVAAYLW